VQVQGAHHDSGRTNTPTCLLQKPTIEILVVGSDPGSVQGKEDTVYRTTA
jgi:hypothetical protein